MEIITLSHGSGGKTTHKLIENLFYKNFKNDILLQKNDSSILQKMNGKVAVTTDSFVIKPIFFLGGDIGKLSICGTINDLAVSGAKPMYITVGFIIEEGLEIGILEKIVMSMAKMAKQANVKVIAGDTKVVEKGSVDKIFINTTGIGLIEDRQLYLCANNIQEGDKVIISGSLGDHGMCIMSQREELGLDANIKSDCNLLNTLIKDILNTSKNIRIMRDPTRGGLATTLNEIIAHSNRSIVLNEKDIFIKEEVMSMCQMLGFDPLYVANEGKVVVIVSKDDANKVLDTMRGDPLGKNATIIGEIIDDNKNRVYLKTDIGGTRILNMHDGELLPRIC
ncbi:hydrogenase expression/formation protein HypE [Marinisporobacter balticus]|uniref:Hydrogenase maturation carbamoyl dehydratase HypE n=1 Tax=Marinisporobacter balticus TaxID=2018667 RepID=A0A4R2KLR4_9FIRM|nr:hydrogenase expression/formation protein HypE [Marinisporobacter balticus]TCO74623.1 hydrogenase maturation carbamoyl dehydratase HypE [Marinisporobacter balticus]